MAELLQQTQLTDEMIQDMRSRIGIPLRARITWNTSSCYDSVKHYALGIGDDNPLYVDRKYGKTTALGGNLASPSFLYTCNPTFVQMGLRGIHGFHAQSDWRWYRPITQGQELKTTIWLDSVEERPSRMGGRSVVTIYASVVSNDRDEVLAHARSTTFRMERGATRERKKEVIEPQRWDEESLQKLEEQYSQEKVRGADPRYWDDVQVGDPIGQIIKGPLCMSDMMAYYAGNMVAPTPAHRLAWKDKQRHPMWYFRNRENGGLEPIIRVHESIEAARSAGVPAPYDVGIQRHSWMVQAITDWMGDDAFLEANTLEYRAFNYYGDVQTFTGEVTRKFEEGGLHKVEIAVRGTSQRGTVTIPGTAVIALPTRGAPPPVAVYHERRLMLKDFLATLPVQPDFSRATEPKQ
jgi:acyl dehydratase